MSNTLANGQGVMTFNGDTSNDLKNTSRTNEPNFIEFYILI